MSINSREQIVTAQCFVFSPGCREYENGFQSFVSKPTDRKQDV